MLYDEPESIAANNVLRDTSRVANLDRLREKLDPLVPIFLLIDPLVGDLMPGLDIEQSSEELNKSRELSWERGIVDVVLPESIQLPHHMHPYLVRLNNVDDPVLDQSFEAAVGELMSAQAGGLDGSGIAAHRVGGWLQTTMHARRLSQAIAAMCSVNTDAFTSARYLRVADRRVFSLLRHVAGDERVSGQLGDIRCWMILDEIGQLSRLDSRTDEVRRLRLTATEWKKMEQGELVHRTLAQWGGS